MDLSVFVNPVSGPVMLKILEMCPIAGAMVVTVVLFLYAMDRREYRFFTSMDKRDEKMEAGFERLASSVDQMMGVIHGCLSRKDGK